MKRHDAGTNVLGRMEGGNSPCRSFFILFCACFGALGLTIGASGLCYEAEEEAASL